MRYKLGVGLLVIAGIVLASHPQMMQAQIFRIFLYQGDDRKLISNVRDALGGASHGPGKASEFDMTGKKDIEYDRNHLDIWFSTSFFFCVAQGTRFSLTFDKGSHLIAWYEVGWDEAC